MQKKSESLERINSIRETNGNFDSCKSCNSCNSCLEPAIYMSYISQNFRLFHYRIYPFETFEFFCSCIRRHCLCECLRSSVSRLEAPLDIPPPRHSNPSAYPCSAAALLLPATRGTSRHTSTASLEPLVGVPLLPGGPPPGDPHGQYGGGGQCQRQQHAQCDRRRPEAGAILGRRRRRGDDAVDDVGCLLAGGLHGRDAGVEVAALGGAEL